MRNIPATYEEVKELLPGESIISKYPNRRQRRFNPVPNSSKLGKGSINVNTVFRTGKYRKFIKPLCDYQKKEDNLCVK